MDKLKGRFFVKKGTLWLLKDQCGKVVKDFGAIEAHTLLSVLVVEQDGLFGLIDLTGEWVLPCEYRNIVQPYNSGGSSGDKHEVLELTDQHDRLWLADRNGKIVTSRSYKEIASGGYSHDLHVNETWNGFADLCDSDEENRHQKFGLFDMVNVREILPAIYEPGVPDYGAIMGRFSTGIPVFHDEDGERRCKLIDAQGNDLIPFEKGFSSIGVPLHDDYLIDAMKNGKWGYINIHGTEKIPFRYDYASDFSFGCAIVGFSTDDGTFGQYGVIGHHGKLLIPFVFRYIVPDVWVEDGKVYAEGLSKDHEPLKMEAELPERQK